MLDNLTTTYCDRISEIIKQLIFFAASGQCLIKQMHQIQLRLSQEVPRSMDTASPLCNFFLPRSAPVTVNNSCL